MDTNPLFENAENYRPDNKNPATCNNTRFQRLDNLAFYLGSIKIKLADEQAILSDDNLTALISEIRVKIQESAENDLYVAFRAHIAKITADSTNGEKRQHLSEAISACRKILRKYKLEYGSTPGETGVKRYGNFSIRQGKIYYLDEPIGIYNQPERLLILFLEAPNNTLSDTEIAHLDDTDTPTSVAPKRVSKLRSILRDNIPNRPDVIKRKNRGATKGYQLVTS